MKTLVTGANGFIGSAMVWELNQAGIGQIVAVDTVGLDQRGDLLKKRNYQLFLRKDEIWNYLKSVESKEIQWVIHMGACSSTTEKNWGFLYENNTLYSMRLFQWCAQHKKNLIYASSAATYGAGEKGFSDETPPGDLEALNLYGKSKALFDQWVVQQTLVPPYWYGLKFFNVFGPNEYHKEKMASLVFKAFHQVRSQGRLGLFKSYDSHYSDGEQKRDFVYVKDVTSWMMELIQKTPASGIYNVGFGEARTWKDLAHAVFQSLERPVHIDWLEMPEDIRNQYQYFTCANMDKWRSQGLSAPRWSLEKGVLDYLRNYLMQKDPWL